MANIASLKPFKKGEDPRRNVTGQNKGSISISALVKAELEKMPKGENKKRYVDLLVKRILNKAIKGGDTKMIEKIWAYIDGMPKNTLANLEDEEGNTVPFKIVQYKGDED